MREGFPSLREKQKARSRQLAYFRHAWLTFPFLEAFVSLERRLESTPLKQAKEYHEIMWTNKPRNYSDIHSVQRRPRLLGSCERHLRAGTNPSHIDSRPKPRKPILIHEIFVCRSGNQIQIRHFQIL